jgi:hypothetical protein
VAISESVLWAVKKRIDARFEDFGEHAVKNIAEPVRAYRFHHGKAGNPVGEHGAGGAGVGWRRRTSRRRPGPLRARAASTSRRSPCCRSTT